MLAAALENECGGVVLVFSKKKSGKDDGFVFNGGVSQSVAVVQIVGIHFDCLIGHRPFFTCFRERKKKGGYC